MAGQCQLHEMLRRILAAGGHSDHLIPYIDVIKAQKRSEEERQKAGWS